MFSMPLAQFSRRRFLQGALQSCFSSFVATSLLRAENTVAFDMMPLGSTNFGKMDALKDAGFSYVEGSISGLLVPHQGEENFLKNLEKIKSYALPIEAMNGYLPGGDYKIAGPTTHHEAIIEYSKVAFQRAKLAGVKVFTLGSGGQRQIPEDFSKEKARKQFSELLGRLGPLAKEAGIVLAIENLSFNETNLGNLLSECHEIVVNSGSEDVFITIDIFHMLNNDEGPEAILKAGDRLRHGHIAEKKDRTTPGVNGQDFVPYFKNLKQVGYQSRMSIEGKWPGDQNEWAPKSYQVLREQLSKVL